ncbi:MAG: HAMP domain-containing sensor histidine kinase [Pseudomonadota bacterium]
MTALSNLLKSWTFRWTILYLTMAVTAAGAVISYLFWQTNDLLTVQVSQTLASEEKGLREQYQLGGLGLLRETVRERARAPGDGIYLLSDQFGLKLAGNLNRVPPELQNSSGGVFEYQRRQLTGETETRQGVGRAIRVQGGASLIVARDIQDQRDFASTSQRILLWGIVVIGLIGLAGGLLVSRYIFRRIDAVTATSRTIMAGNLSERIPVNGSGDELDRLSDNLNAMLERIELLMSGMREVSDNIAHDLKTPLNRLRNRVEGALREGGGAQTYRTALEETIDEADALIKTFNALLSIARLEAGAAGDNMVMLDLAQVVGDVAELYEPVVEEAGHTLTFETQDVPEGEAKLTVLGDRQLIGQALTNLIDNALKYAVGNDGDGGAGLAIKVRVAGVGETAEVSVADNGPGIPEAERERVFRRFVRLEESRSRPGSGLGLSVVSAVARLHGATIALEDNSPGLRAIMRVPRVTG